MKRFTQILAVVLIAGMMLTVACPVALAGRLGGPLNTVVNVPAGQSFFLDIPFDAGPAIVSIHGHGVAFMDVYLYDSDGHVATAIGSLDYKTVYMAVYRPGMFRVEIRNGGIRDDAVTVTTN